MDAFLLNCHYSILYEWVKYQLNDFEERKDQWAWSLSQSYKEYNMNIRFYDSGVIEEIVSDNVDNHILYYIHFQFLNFAQSTAILKEFILFLKKLKQEKKHILICCSCGLTSSLFQEELQKTVDENKLNFEISASDIYSLQEKYKNYDFILLTPQVSHYKPKLMKTIKKPIISISPTDFACHNYHQIISIIYNYLEEKDK